MRVAAHPQQKLTQVPHPRAPELDISTRALLPDQSVKDSDMFTKTHDKND